jgi:nucleotide-binding universal stress UspA family protein
MYKRILLPTDGSDASRRAIVAGIALARGVGAEIVGLHVTPTFHIVTANSRMLEDTPDQYATDCSQRARRVLAAVEGAAHDAGVTFRLEHASSDDPYEAIVDTAKRLHCDLIVMASHGRRGVKGLLLGSETQKVLVHSAIPVLVQR